MADRRPREEKTSFLLGVRLDKGDGHRRVSRGKGFVAMGGTKDGHDHLRETVAEISDEVKRRGREMSDVEKEEFEEILDKVSGKLGPAPE
ncbi:MAG: hypothetical protein ACYTDX_07545 [Planctomycetota bacterium]|jgi:hypothetical protein